MEQPLQIVGQMTFRYIDPPFNFNHPNVAEYPPEVTGNYLLKSMASRLGWASLADRSLLDFGCGVRFARTIANLDIELNCYTGDRCERRGNSMAARARSRTEIPVCAPRRANSMYNPQGKPMVEHTTLPFANERFDAVCMFSVITHQAPEESRAIFSLIRKSFTTRHLYFTAFIDEKVDGYIDADSANSRHQSTYNQDLMHRLLSGAGWGVERVYEPSFGQQTAFVCLPL